MLMEAFLGRHYPDVRVIRVHSDTNIFRRVFLCPCFSSRADDHGGEGGGEDKRGV